MKKRLTALLLGFVLCLSLVGTAFASEEAFEPAEYDGKAEITAEPGGTEAVIYIEGLTAGRAYYGWSLMLIRDGAPTPITLYNPKAGALEAGLRVYNGKPMVNSVNGKQEEMDKVFSETFLWS